MKIHKHKKKYASVLFGVTLSIKRKRFHKRIKSEPRVHVNEMAGSSMLLKHSNVDLASNIYTLINRIERVTLKDMLVIST